MKKSKWFNWLLTFTLLSQIIVASASSVAALNDETEANANGLVITDENGTTITSATIEQTDRITIGVESTNALDQSLSVHIPGMVLDQEATNQANTENKVTVMYSEEAENVLINWQSANGTTASEPSNELGVESIIPESPTHKKVMLTMKPSTAGTHTISVKSNRDGVDVFATPLSLTVLETASEATGEVSKKEPTTNPAPNEEKSSDVNERNEKERSTRALSGGIEIFNEATQTWGELDELKAYTDYKKSMKYRMTFTTDESRSGVKFTHHWDINNSGNNRTWGTMVPNSEKVIFAADGSEFPSMDLGDGRIIVDVVPGTYNYEFEVNFNDGVDFSSLKLFDLTTMTTTIKPDLSIQYENASGDLEDVSVNEVTITGVSPMPSVIKFIDKVSGDPVTGVKGYLSGGVNDIPFEADANGMASLSANEPGVNYKVYITAADEHATSDNPKANYSYYISGTQSVYLADYAPRIQEMRLLSIVPEVALEIRFDPTSNQIITDYYGSTVTSTQTVRYADGAESEKIHLFTSAEDTGKKLAYVPGSTKVIRYHGEVPDAPILVDDALSWQKVGDLSAGYSLNYVLEFPGDPLKQDDRIEFINDWTLEPTVPLKTTETYSLRTNVTGTDKNNNDSMKAVAENFVKGVSKNAIRADAKKSVKDTSGHDLDSKTVKVGDKLVYEIIVEAVGDQYSQISIPKITDQLPEGLIADKRSDLVVKLNGTVLSNSAFGPYTVSGNTFTLNVPSAQRILSITDDLAERQMIVSIEVTVGASASGTLLNTASADSQIRKDPLVNINEWDPVIPNLSNEVKNYVETDIELTKKTYGLDDKELTASYVGETFKYEIVASVPAESGAYHHAVIIDTLPTGIQYVPNSTKIIVNGVEQSIGTDDTMWFNNNKELNLTLANPILTGSDVHIVFEVISDETIEKQSQPVTNTANIVGAVKDNSFPKVPKDSESPVEFGYRPGKLAAEKSVLQGSTNVDKKEVKVGDTLTYKLVVENTEGADTMVREVIMEDKLPVGLTYVGNVTFTSNALKQEVEYDPSTSTLTFKVGDIKGGEKIDITFDVLVNDEATGAIMNEAKATGTNDFINVPLETPTSKVDNYTKPEPTIEKSINKGLASTGDTLTYTLVISNSATQPEMIDGKVTDTLPAEVEYVPNSTVINGNPTQDVSHNYWNGNTFTMTGLTLKTGETITVKFDVSVKTTEIKKRYPEYSLSNRRDIKRWDTQNSR